MPPLLRCGDPLKLLIIRCHFFLFIGQEPTTWPANNGLLMRNVTQLCLATNNILLSRIWNHAFLLLAISVCVKMADRFASQRYSLKIKLGDRMIKHQYWTQLSQNILMMNQVVHGKGQRNERRLQGRGLKAWVAHLYWNFQQYPRGPFTNYDSKWLHRKTITDLPRLHGLFSSWQASFVFPSL